MHFYTLTESYGDLYNPRVMEPGYYANLRFIDELTSDQIQEVMESLIWEFMDYGDTFEESVKFLEMAFSDDHILYESLGIIMEVTARPFKATTEFRPQTGYQKPSVAYKDGKRIIVQPPDENPSARARRAERASASKIGRTIRAAYVGAKSSAKKEWEKPDENPSARARRAERASAIRGALRGAKESVKGALHRTHQKVTNMRSQLVAKGNRLASKTSSAALRAQAALSKVGRTARAAYAGAKSSAKKEWETPSKAPSSRIPGKQRTQQVRAAAKKEMGDVFAKDTKYVSPAIEKLRAAAAAAKAKEGRTIHGGPAPKPPGPPKKRVTSDARQLSLFNKKGNPINPNKELKGAAAQARFNASEPAGSKKIEDDLDYDLLIQYMIEDIIDEGYAIDEDEALCILEDMNIKTFEELAEQYIYE